MNKPLLICLTPVRNEAWVLNAFLKATSLWADHIIIADQGSTDGSREIALNYSKVIIVDNLSTEMQQTEARQLLFNETKKIKGKKILFALDADEFISGNFIQTESWQKILNSKPGEVFCFKWITLCPSINEFTQDNLWMHWASNIGENNLQGDFPYNYIHEWRLPYPKSLISQTCIDDISFIHFANINEARQKMKQRFYQVFTKCKEPNKSLISLYRMYHNEIKRKKLQINNSIYSFYNKNGLNLFDEIKLSDLGDYYKDEIFKCFDEKGIAYFQGLDIWEESFINNYGIKDPRSLKTKLLHLYLKLTQRSSNLIVIRGVDKVLKKIGL